MAPMAFGDGTLTGPCVSVEGADGMSEAEAVGGSTLQAQRGAQHFTGAHHLRLVEAPRQPAAAPAELLMDALLRLDAVRAALGARDVATLIASARSLSSRGARDGQRRLSALLAQIVRAATLGDLDGVDALLGQAEREAARIEASTRSRARSAR